MAHSAVFMAMKKRKMVFCVGAIVALLPSWLTAIDLSLELQDGHLLRWQGQWSPLKSFEARAWGRDGGWLSGSLKAEPFLMGPLRAAWSESAPWVWAPDPLARPGTWGGVFQMPWGSAWLIQEPAETRVGGQALFRLATFRSGVAYQRSWPDESDCLRGLALWKSDLWEVGVRAEQVSTAGELPTLTGRTDLRVHPPGIELGTGLERLETGKVLWRTLASVWGVSTKAEVLWEDREAAVGEAGWSFEGKQGAVGVALMRSTREWSGKFHLSLDQVGWSVGLSGSFPFTGCLREVSAFGSFRANSTQWSGRASWKMTTSEEVGATLTLGWAQVQGPWRAELKMEAPHLVAQWFGPENHTTLLISTSLKDQSPQ